MPAMSPTMEKGGVTDWKFKEGDSFNSGDVLLEVETDKAQIDVEAQDDGKIAKILIQNGGKDIPVGQPIAILADPSDDLATLELPKVEAAAEKAAESVPVEKAAAPKPTTPKKESAASSGSVSEDADPKQIFFPSVASLLEENNISRQDAISKIKATGAHGRLVKGDVLAYLGKIPQESVNKITSFIQDHSKLDLSNIEKLKIQPKETNSETKLETKETKPEPTEAKQTKPKPEPKVITRIFDLENLLEFQASATEKGFEPFTVKEYINNASKRSETYAYQTHAKPSDYYDEIFEDLTTPGSNVERFKIKLDIPKESTGRSLKNPLNAIDYFNEDVFDELTSSIPHSKLTVKLEINPKVLDSEEKAKIYLNRLEHYLYDLNLRDI